MLHCDGSHRWDRALRSCDSKKFVRTEVKRSNSPVPFFKDTDNYQ